MVSCCGPRGIPGNVLLVVCRRVELEPAGIEAPDNADKRMVQVIAHTVNEMPRHDNLIAEDLTGRRHRRAKTASVVPDFAWMAGSEGRNENDEMAVEVL